MNPLCPRMDQFSRAQRKKRRIHEREPARNRGESHPTPPAKLLMTRVCSLRSTLGILVLGAKAPASAFPRPVPRRQPLPS